MTITFNSVILKNTQTEPQNYRKKKKNINIKSQIKKIILEKKIFLLSGNLQ